MRVCVAGGIVASLAVASAVFLWGCGSALPPGSPPIANVWLGRCGACHVRVEPGTRSRAQLEEALKRHRKRVRLSEEEWIQMIDYLARDPARTSAVD